MGDGTVLLPPGGLSPDPVSSGNPAELEPGRLAPATGNAGQCWAAQATPVPVPQVDDLKAKLAIQEIELKQKNENADKLIHVVGVETEKVSKEKAIADEEEVKVEVINKVGDRHGFRRATDGLLGWASPKGAQTSRTPWGAGLPSTGPQGQTVALL